MTARQMDEQYRAMEAARRRQQTRMNPLWDAYNDATQAPMVQPSTEIQQDWAPVRGIPADDVLERAEAIQRLVEEHRRNS